VIRNLSTDCKLIKVKAYSAANTSAVVSDEIDMQGYKGILALANFGTPAANNTIEIGGYATTGGSPTRLTGAVTAPGATDAFQALEVYNPSTRFVQVTATRGTSSTLDAMFVLLYGKDRPVANLTAGTVYSLLLANV
jgi:hypothetical protein